ncbi:hypothetical protein Tco_1151471 [Tanacetum coccineum]
MSAHDDFSLHDDEELSLHDDASLAGSLLASNKEMLLLNTTNIYHHNIFFLEVIQNGKLKEASHQGMDGVYRVLSSNHQSKNSLLMRKIGMRGLIVANGRFQKIISEVFHGNG